MKKNIGTAIAALILILATGCNDEDYLNRPPSNILTEDQVFNDPGLTLSAVARLYDRYWDFNNLDNWSSMADINSAFFSENGWYNDFGNTTYGFGTWGSWDYNYVRDINLFLERCEATTGLKDGEKSRFLAEARFLRAAYYFEIAKRMGGVPLILKTETYDFSGDPSYLRHPRATEEAIYDFVIAEMEAVKDILPSDVNQKARASKGAALAMEARAALYAGSIAKYGANTPNVSLPGKEVGIPASQATKFYTIALRASQEIIAGNAGGYSLYNKKPELSENFASLFYDKSNNPEVIFVRDFQLASGRTQGFTIANQPRFNAEEEEGGRLNPSLNLAQLFETTDGQYKPFANADASGNLIKYDNIDDIFQGRDARLQGTIIVPGSSWKGRPVDIFGGYIMPDGSIVSADERGKVVNVPNVGNVQAVGYDGPIDRQEFTAQTGFYIRKYQDPKTGSGQRGVRSDVWQIRYRYAEVLLNAAEAAFELGQPAVAAGYMNQVRSRAGITTPLVAADITFDKIFHERNVEFAFEGLYFFDIKRFRIATKILDGQSISATEITQNIGVATKRNTQVYGMIPYKTTDGKFVYKIMKPSPVTGSRHFRDGNYYSEISQDIINNNPLIVKNPNH